MAGAAAQFQRMGIQGTADLPRPTIRPAANFSAERDADIIRKAMKGMGKSGPVQWWEGVEVVLLPDAIKRVSRTAQTYPSQLLDLT